MMPEMLPIELIVALVLALAELVKVGLKRWLRLTELHPLVVPLVAVLLGALLNILNAWIFGPELTREVIREVARLGILAAAAASGLWSAGTNYVEKRLAQSSPRA